MASDGTLHLEAIHLREHDVEYHQVRLHPPHQFQALTRMGGAEQLQIEALQIGGQRLGQRFIGVDQKDLLHGESVRDSTGKMNSGDNAPLSPLSIQFYQRGP